MDKELNNYYGMYPYTKCPSSPKCNETKIILDPVIDVKSKEKIHFGGISPDELCVVDIYPNQDFVGNFYLQVSSSGFW